MQVGIPQCIREIQLDAAVRKCPASIECAVDRSPIPRGMIRAGTLPLRDALIRSSYSPISGDSYKVYILDDNGLVATRLVQFFQWEVQPLTECYVAARASTH